MKKIVTYILLICIIFCCACSTNNNDRIEVIDEKTNYNKTIKGTALPIYKKTYDIIGGENVMPIGGWWGPYTPEIDSNNLPDYVNDYYYNLIKKAGINIITVAPETFSYNSQNVIKSIDLAEKYNMGYFVYDDYLRDDDLTVTEVKERISQYINKKSVVGVHLMDEPSMEQFDYLSKIYKTYNEANEDFVEKSLYVNLFPNYTSATILSGNNKAVSYDTYVNNFVNKITPDFISYDNYPFSRAGEGVFNKKLYFQNLLSVKDISEKSKIPFWVFVQTGGGWNDEGKPSTPRYPSQYELMWNVNTSLALGAKSIQYFTIIQPEEYTHTDTSVDYERIGIFGADGRINEWYFYVKKINSFISSIDHILMNSVAVGTIGKGEAIENNFDIYNSNMFQTDSYKELSSVDAKDVLIGCFDYLGGTAFYVVNNSIEESQTITLNFSKRYGYDIYKQDDTFSYSGKRAIVNLEKGEGALLVLR